MQPDAPDQVKPAPRFSGDDGEPLIALYRGTSWVSKAIRWQTFSDYSHAAIWLPDGQVIEAWHKGGVAVHDSLGAVHKPGTEVDLFRVEGVWWEKAIASAMMHVGQGYSFSNIFRLALRWGEPECRHPEKLICSQLVFMAVQDGGVNLLTRICPSRVSPRDIGISPRLQFVRRVKTEDYSSLMLGTPIDERSGFAVPDVVFALVVAGLLVGAFALFHFTTGGLQP